MRAPTTCGLRAARCHPCKLLEFNFDGDVSGRHPAVGMGCIHHFQKFVVRRRALRGLTERLPIPKGYGVLACMHSRDAKLSGTVPQPDALYGGGILTNWECSRPSQYDIILTAGISLSPLGSPVRERNRASGPGWRHK
jgi:hypothetical protein